MPEFVKALGKPYKTERVGELAFDYFKVKGFEWISVGAKTSNQRPTTMMYSFGKGAVTDWKSALKYVGIDPAKVKALEEKDANGKTVGAVLIGIPKCNFAGFDVKDGVLIISWP